MEVIISASQWLWALVWNRCSIQWFFFFSLYKKIIFNYSCHLVVFDRLKDTPSQSPQHCSLHIHSFTESKAIYWLYWRWKDQSNLVASLKEHTKYSGKCRYKKVGGPQIVNTLVTSWSIAGGQRKELALPREVGKSFMEVIFEPWLSFRKARWEEHHR